MAENVPGNIADYSRQQRIIVSDNWHGCIMFLLLMGVDTKNDINKRKMANVRTLLFIIHFPFKLSYLHL